MIMGGLGKTLNKNCWYLCVIEWHVTSIAEKKINTNRDLSASSRVCMLLRFYTA